MDLYEKTHLGMDDARGDAALSRKVGLTVEVQEMRRDAGTASREETRHGRRLLPRLLGHHTAAGRARRRCFSRQHCLILLALTNIDRLNMHLGLMAGPAPGWDIGLFVFRCALRHPPPISRRCRATLPPPRLNGAPASSTCCIDSTACPCPR